MSTITSLIIALLLMVLVGLILWIIAMNLPAKNIPQLVSYNGTPESEENLK